MQDTECIKRLMRDGLHLPHMHHEQAHTDRAKRT